MKEFEEQRVYVKFCYKIGRNFTEIFQLLVYFRVWIHRAVSFLIAFIHAMLFVILSVVGQKIKFIPFEKLTYSECQKKLLPIVIDGPEENLE
jgi:hypothetical protein